MIDTPVTPFTDLSISLKTREVWQITLESTAFLLILLTGFLGNLLLCVAVYKTRALRNLQNYYLVSLAVTDISSAVLCMPITLAVLMTGRWPFGDFVCQLQASLIFILAVVSLVTLAMIAVNRYVKMVRSANLYQKIFSKRNIFISIVMSWTISVLMVLSSFLFGKKAFTFHPGKCLCFQRLHDNKGLRLYFVVSYFLMASVVFPPIVFSYYKIFRKVRSHFNQVAGSNLHDDNSRAFVEEAKIAKMLFVTCFACFFCWSPSITIDLYEAHYGQYTVPREAYLFNIFTLWCGSAVNPFIYGLMRKEFKDAYKNVITCKDV